MGFFGTASICLIVISVVLLVPVLIEYLRTGMVPRFPTLIVCGFMVIASIQSFFAGMQLQNSVQKNRQDFEMELLSAENNKKKLGG